MPFALCPLPFALCPLPFALCPLPYALCPMPNAQCPTPNKATFFQVFCDLYFDIYGFCDDWLLTIDY
jgi:hypothetical protein